MDFIHFGKTKIWHLLLIFYSGMQDLVVPFKTFLLAVYIQKPACVTDY